MGNLIAGAKSIAVRLELDRWGGIVFTLGALLGIIFDGVAFFSDLESSAFWGDPQEAVYYSPSLDTQSRLGSLRCPIFITPGGHSVISATITNPGREPVMPIIRAYISQGVEPQYRSETETVNLQAGESRTLQWAISTGDILYGRFILARALLYEVYPSASRTQSCGMFLVNVPFLSGTELTVLALAAYLVAMVAGSYLWTIKNWPSAGGKKNLTFYGMRWMTVVLAAGALLNILGWWVMLSGLLWLMAVLIALGLIGESKLQPFPVE